MADPVNIRVLVPRIRRAIEGVGEPPGLSDDEVKDLAADALADVVLYTGSAFGHQLVVLEVDATTGAPSEYGTSEALELHEQSVIAAQAALNRFFYTWKDAMVQETIRDEGQEWSYTKSASLVRDALKALIDQRDRALDALNQGGTIAVYESFIAVRDAVVSRITEPWVAGALAGGQDVDPRFG